jgi:drug/metabolite transporter (DMT)-like permease
MPALSRRVSGLLWVAVSAAGFGSMAIFAKAAYAAGVDLPTMLFLRFALAGLVLVAVMVALRRRWPGGRDLAILLLMGAVGYVGQSFCYFAALQYASAGVTALLLYLYPALVVLIGWFLLARPPAPLRLLAVVLALTGSAMTVAGSLAGSVRGILLGASAALIYAVYILVGEGVTRRSGSLPSATVVILAAAFVYGGWWAAGGAPLPQGVGAWSAVLGIAMLSTVIAILGFFAGLQRLGAADASTASTLEPLTTIVLAAIFLGEVLTPLQLAGGAAIVIAVVLIARGPAAR